MSPIPGMLMARVAMVKPGLGWHTGTLAHLQAHKWSFNAIWSAKVFLRNDVLAESWITSWLPMTTKTNGSYSFLTSVKDSQLGENLNRVF